jgi:hypothetical protein
MGIRHAQSENETEAIRGEHVGIVERPAAPHPLMNDKLIQLAERRERLVAQAAAQRIALAQNIEAWRIPLARVDLGLAALRFIKRHPAFLVGGSILFAALRPGRVVKWLRRGWVAWQMLRGLRRR